MASIKPYPYRKGWWRAHVRRRGHQSSAVFPTKQAALAWANRVEGEVLAGYHGEIPNITVRELLDRYAKEVSPGKKGARWELVRLEALGRDRIAQVRLRQLDAPHVSDWQQRRLEAVSGASVRRERNLLNNVFQVAIKEWRWLKRNPFEGVRIPKDGRARERIASDGELITLLSAASTGLARVIQFALETGMRAGEIGALKYQDVNGRVALIVDSKNGTAREVPLSELALAQIGNDHARNGYAFGLTANSISELFARLTKECGIQGLTFHDLRRTAITRLAKKLNPFELAKIVGHKDLKMTLNTYYKADMQELAKKL